MGIASKTFRYLVPLIKALPARRKRALLSLVPLAIFAGISEFLVVATVSRLFNVVVGEANRPSLPFSELIPDDPRFRVIGLVVLYISLNWFSSFLKLFLRSCQAKLKTGVWKDLCEMAQKRIIAQPYEYFLGQSKNDISATVLVTVSRVSEYFVLPLLQLCSGIFIIIVLSIAVLIIGKMLAVILIISLVVSYLVITILITPYLRFAARQRINLELQANNVLVESMRTIADVQLSGAESYFEKRYAKSVRNAVPFIWKADVIPEIPRALIEPFGITLIFAAGMFPLLSNNNSSELIKIVPFLATIAVASLKLTPPLQDSFRALTALRSGLPDVIETLKLLELPISRLSLASPEVPSADGVAPRNSIRLNHVSYKYPKNKELTVKDIYINIAVGSRVAFVGTTGSGKTTTANLLLCLLKPTVGNLQIDGIDVSDEDIPAWQANCAYVPQSISLLNSNVLENVAFAREPDSVDESEVWDALQAAQLADLVSEFPMGLYTPIGDDGIRLSGGQRQRLAIARAFYRKAKLLVLDEATSALDNKTEAEVMDSIEMIGRRCTLVVIAHRLSTVMRSDCIYEFNKGSINAYGTFEQLQQKSDGFKDLASFEERILKS